MALLTALAGAAGATTAAATGAGAAASAAGAAGAAAGGAAAVGAVGSSAGVLGSLSSLVGTGAGVVGQFMQQKAAQKAEDLRERQMNLEAAREKRQIVRKAIIARSTAVANATSQGAQAGSGLQGGVAAITNEQGQGLLANNQNLEIGRGIFAANRDMARAGTISSMGQGLSTIGAGLVNNMELYGRLGTYYNGNGG
jgi:hypothetical protein